MADDEDDDNNNADKVASSVVVVDDRMPLGEYMESVSDNDWGVVHLRPIRTCSAESMRKAKFTQLLVSAFTPTLSPCENHQFLERFRFVLCTSQLLEDHVSVTMYSRHTVFEDKVRDWTSGSKSSSNKRKKLWIGSGGCVLVVALLVTWAIKNPRIGTSHQASLAFMVCICVAMYLYAHARRGLARKLRARALTFVTELVTTCQNFDRVVMQALRFVQEVEIMAKGQHPLHRHKQRQRCQTLRAALVASLALAASAIDRTTDCVRPYASAEVFQQLRMTYHMPMSAEDDMASATTSSTMRDLKAAFLRVHLRRRVLLCALMSVEIKRELNDIKPWTQVADQMGHVGELLTQLVSEIQTSLQDELAPPDHAADAVLQQARSGTGFHSFAESLRVLQTKMYVLRENTIRTMAQDDNHFLADYDAIGRNLHSLMRDWEQGKARLHEQLRPTDLPLPSSPPLSPKLSSIARTMSPPHSMPPTPLLSDAPSTMPDMTNTSLLDEDEEDDRSEMVYIDDAESTPRRSKRDSWGDWGPRFPPDSGFSRSLEMLLEEPFAEKPATIDRYAERLNAAPQSGSSIVRADQGLVTELKNVLSRRTG